MFTLLPSNASREWKTSFAASSKRAMPKWSARSSLSSSSSIQVRLMQESIIYLLSLSHVLGRHTGFLQGTCLILEFIPEALRKLAWSKWTNKSSARWSRPHCPKINNLLSHFWPKSTKKHSSNFSTEVPPMTEQNWHRASGHEGNWPKSLPQAKFLSHSDYLKISS